MSFSGRNVIISGSSEGIGLASARLFLEQGANVLINGRTDNKLEHAYTSLYDDFGERVHMFQGDVSNPEVVKDLVQYASVKLSGVDILVNNVGGGSEKRSVDEIDLEDWNAILSSNLSSAFMMAKEVIPIMKQQGFGRIVNVSSVAGRHKGRLSGIQYSSAKAGLQGMSRHLAWDLAPFAITVNVVAPGFVNTERALRKWESRSEEDKAFMLSGVPMKRFAEPEEVACAIVFLASTEASYITGATIDVNGGSFMN